MSKTRHITKRMNQRGITSEMLEIAKQFGEYDQGDKLILSKKDIDAYLKEMERISKVMKKMQSRGGVVLVSRGDIEITTYALNSYKPDIPH